jgi:hypothetical protein
LEDLGVDEKVIFKCIIKKLDVGLGWIVLAWGRER